MVGNWRGISHDGSLPPKRRPNILIMKTLRGEENNAESRPIRSSVGVYASSSSSALEGKNNPSVDVAALQAAVDKGGLVSLRGEFDFGGDGSVAIRKDVSIVGEDSQGAVRTKIKGGRLTLKTIAPEDETSAGPKISVSRIHFDGAAWTPLYFGHASQVAITANRITNVRPQLSIIEGRRPYHAQQGMLIGTWLVPTLDRLQPYRANLVTGPIVIEDDEIELTSPRPTETLGLGVFLIRATGVTASIARNKIYNASRNAVETLDNFRDAEGHGSIIIQDNDIETPAEGISFPTPNTPNGILAGYFLDRSGAATDPRRAIPHIVVSNIVRARGAASIAIIVLADGSFLRGNHLTVGGAEATAVLHAGSRSYIGQNRIEGTAQAGIRLFPLAPFSASHNQLVDNDFGEPVHLQAMWCSSKAQPTTWWLAPRAAFQTKEPTTV